MAARSLMGFVGFVAALAASPVAPANALELYTIEVLAHHGVPKLETHVRRSGAGSCDPLAREDRGNLALARRADGCSRQAHVRRLRAAGDFTADRRARRPGRVRRCSNMLRITTEITRFGS